MNNNTKRGTKLEMRELILSHSYGKFSNSRKVTPYEIALYNKSLKVGESTAIERFDNIRMMIRECFEGMIRHTIDKHFQVMPGVNRDAFNTLIQRHSRILFTELSETMDIFKVHESELYDIYAKYIDDVDGLISELYTYSHRVS